MSLEVEKERMVQALCAHYAQDHLSTGELESRFERVYQSVDRRQLDTVLIGLPAIGTATRAMVPLYSLAPAPTGLAPNEKRYAAIFSSVEKQGAWTPAERLAVKAIFGSVTLDFRDAALPPDGIDLHVEVMFGDATILLPPGIGAEVDCSAVMGSVDDKSRAGLPGAPGIRVHGLAVMGSISVITKLPKQARMETWRKQLNSFFRTGGDASP